ncbi:uncharacterized protein ACNS7B_017152 [Menidia menidia]
MCESSSVVSACLPVTSVSSPTPSLPAPRLIILLRLSPAWPDSVLCLPVRVPDPACLTPRSRLIPLDCLPGLDPCSPLDPLLDYPYRIIPGLTPRCRPRLPDHPLWFVLSNKPFELIVCLRVFLGPLTRTLQYVLANMDPNPDGQWQAGVERSISQLEAGVTEILKHLQDLASPAAPLPQASPPTPVSPPVSRSPPEPRLAPPGFFGGDPEQCRAFLTQCEICFELQPSCFPTDRARVAYVISLLEGKARLWGASEWQIDTAACHSYAEFARELTRVFSPVLPCRESSRGLLTLRQGERTVSAYVIDFHLLAAECRWNEWALMDVFIHGLNSRIKDELATRDYPRSLRELEQLASRVDVCLQERQGARHAAPSPWVPAVPPATPSFFQEPEEPEPMQLGRTTLSKEERPRRMQQGLCLYCGGAGHVVRSCPVKSPSSVGGRGYRLGYARLAVPPHQLPLASQNQVRVADCQRIPGPQDQPARATSLASASPPPSCPVDGSPAYAVRGPRKSRRKPVRGPSLVPASASPPPTQLIDGSPALTVRRILQSIRSDLGRLGSALEGGAL